MKIVLSVYGENHSQVSSIYDHIGEVYFAQKDYSKALYYFEESLKIRLSLFGENHPEVALSYYSIGSCLLYTSAAGRFEEDYMADYNRAMNYQLSALNTTDKMCIRDSLYAFIFQSFTFC